MLIPHRVFFLVCDILILGQLLLHLWVSLHSQVDDGKARPSSSGHRIKAQCLTVEPHRSHLSLSLSPELVLKVRIQNPSARENDFIEVELDRQELTYRSLLRVCCRELGISAEHVEKIRKLPNTMLRKVRGF